MYWRTLVYTKKDGTREEIWDYYYFSKTNLKNPIMIGRHFCASEKDFLDYYNKLIG